jgi:hypothetical protein
VADVVIAQSSLPVFQPSDEVARITSICIDSSGAFAVVSGTEGADSTFSTVRGAAGGPPYIPVDSIELGQVKVASATAAIVSVSQILQVENTHREMATYPSYEVDSYTGTVIFEQTLPAIHEGNETKAVFASYAEPVFSEQKYANDFVPAEISYSSSSSQVYGATLGTTTESLGKVTFTAILKNGITDPILAKKGQNIFIRYYQDKYKLPHILSQGKISFARTFGAAAEPKVTCTLAVTKASVERAS